MKNKEHIGIIFGGNQGTLKVMINSALIGIPLIGSVFALLEIFQGRAGYIELFCFAIFYIFVGLGVALGLHRYYSHHSFDAHPLIVFLLGMGGSMSFQGTIHRWVIDHRRHHAHTDRPGDTHSPHIDQWGSQMHGIRGFLYGHIGWMFDRTVTDSLVYGAGLDKNWYVRFFSNTYIFWIFLSLFLPYTFGLIFGDNDSAWRCLLIGGCLRTTILHNVVWSVNSVGHTFGTQNFKHADRSTNNWFLAVLTFGDGWHNNHHRFPRSYRHGLLPHEIDVNGFLIDLMQKYGLAWNVIRVSPAQVSLPAQ